MRYGTISTITLLLSVMLMQATASAYVLPYDPYPWCANYSGRSGGASNCGFLTLEQCMATVSGIGGFCGPNQFYNPQRPAARAHKRRAS